MRKAGRLVVAGVLFASLALFIAGCADCPVCRMLSGRSSESKAAPAVTVSAGAETAQTQCPVLGGPIDKKVYLDYEGRRVYFCCEMCKTTFLKDPAKYLANLPDGTSAK